MKKFACNSDYIKVTKESNPRNHSHCNYIVVKVNFSLLINYLVDLNAADDIKACYVEE